MLGQELIEEIESKIEEAPLPLKSKTWGVDYQFPTLSALDGKGLSDWLSRFADWHGYATRLLMKAAIEFDVIESTYKAILSKISYKEYNPKTKPTKDYFEGKLLTEDDDAIQLRTRIIAKNAEVESLKSLVALYALQLNAVSREISRRAYDAQKGF